MIAPAFLIVGLFVSFSLPFQGRLLKRIAHGYELQSHDDYRTYHFVHMLVTWGCITNQVNHEVSGCQEKPICGGTIFHPEFVFTAAHCVSYTEFYLRDKSQIYDSSFLSEISQEDIGYFGLVDRGVNIVSNQPHRKHAFYSSISLITGDVDFTARTQKRHALKIFPHPTFTEGRGKFSLSDHDVAIIQVCEPFEITSRVKTVPMMPLNKLTTHFQSVVQRSATCLYIGFGKTENPKDQHFITGTYRTVYSRFLRYTWRQTACPTECNLNKTAGPDPPRNPCVLCSDHIPPFIGTPDDGDSGGPVVCDGYFIGVFVAAYYNTDFNFSMANTYPVHCIKDAITPERLDFYKSVPEEDRKLHPLGPVSLRRLDSRQHGSGPMYQSSIK